MRRTAEDDKDVAQLGLFGRTAGGQFRRTLRGEDAELRRQLDQIGEEFEALSPEQQESLLRQGAQADPAPPVRRAPVIKFSAAGTRRLFAGAAAMFVLLAALQFIIPIYRYIASTKVTATVSSCSEGRHTTCTLTWTLDGVPHSATETRSFRAAGETAVIRVRGDDIVGLPVRALWGAVILLLPAALLVGMLVLASAGPRTLGPR